MAKKTAGFFDLHAEKLTLGLCIALVAGAAAYSLGGSRFAVNEMGPAQLVQSVGEAADSARQAVQSARPQETKSVKKDPSKDPVALMQKWYGESAEGLLKIAQVEPMLPRAVPFPPPYVAVSGDSAESRRNLAQIVSPSVPMVIVGEPVEMTFPNEIPTFEEYDGRPPGANAKKVKKPYVSVAAQVDLVEQDANFRTENYPDGSYLEVVQVHLQRKDVNDPRRGWEDVNTYLPFKPMTRPKFIDRGGGSFKFEGIEGFRRNVSTGAEPICRPKLPSTAASIPPVPYLDEPPKRTDNLSPSDAAREAERRAKSWIDRAKAAMGGKRPFKDRDYDAAYLLARSAAGTLGAPDKLVQSAKDLMQEIIRKMPKERREAAPAVARSPERLMPIVAHDLDALPGHTYVYRMRYEVFNVYAGNPGELSNPDDARKLTVFSGWSPESRPVEITGDTYFYLTKADEKKGEVTVTVFKVGRRGTEKNEYRIRIGEEIGRKEKRGTKGDFSTNALCVDIDFDRVVNGKKDVAMIYMDMTDGILRERILSLDRTDKVLEKLSEQKSASR